MKKLRKCALWLLVLVMMIGCIPANVLAEEALETVEESDPAGAAARVRGSVSGTARYDLIFSFLDELNAYRRSKGAGDLVLDAGLTNFALQRAAEQLVYCGHERPDGSSAFPGSLFQGYCAGEICWLLESPQSAHDILVGFMSSPGHDSVMRDNAYTAAGIGIVETPEGALGVVVNFRNGGTAMARRTDRVAGKWSLSVLPKYFVPAIAPDEIYYSDVPLSITIYGRNCVYSSKIYRYDVEQSSVTSIKSLTPDTAAVTAGNKLVIKSAGDVKLEIKAAGKTFTAGTSVNKGSISSKNVTGLLAGAVWNGSGFDVPPRFIYNDNGTMKELVLGTDYLIKQAEMLETGEIRCFIMGIGSFTGFGYITLKADDTYITPDVYDPGLWYYNSVKWAADNGYISRSENFCPNSACTRALAVLYLYKLAGEPAVSYEPVFSDVHESDWYADAVMWAVENGITVGYGQGKFSPDVGCNRAMIVQLLLNYYRYSHPDFVDEIAFNGAFSDVKESDWFAEAVSWAVENKITSGYGAGTFQPYAICTRAMIITFVRSMSLLP